MQTKTVLYIVIVVLSLLVIGMAAYWAYDYGVRKTEEKFNSVQVDTTKQVVIDSLLTNALDKINQHKTKSNVIYQKTQKIYNTIIESYEKIDTLHPYTDRDSIIRSLTSISNTK